jgi:hypothetical protein
LLSLLNVVVDVDLLVDERDAVAVLGLQLGRDVDHRPAHLRLAELRGGEQQGDGLLADHVVQGDAVHVIRRLARLDALDVAGGARDRVGLDDRRLLAWLGHRCVAAHRHLIGSGDELPGDLGDHQHGPSAGLVELDGVRLVDRGEEVGLGRRLPAAEGGFGDEQVGGRRIGPEDLVGAR